MNEERFDKLKEKGKSWVWNGGGEGRWDEHEMR